MSTLDTVLLANNPQLKRVLDAAKRIDLLCYGTNETWRGMEVIKRDLLTLASELHRELKRLEKNEE